jgi:signal peptidase II
MHILTLIVISTLVILVDQGTKILVMREMVIGQSIPVIEGFLSFTYIRNPGAAFGFLSSSSESFRIPFFLGISAVAIGVVLFFYLKEARENRLLQVGLSFILGGAIGNMIDRIRFQEVVDFIDAYLGQLHWPAFNVADSAITVGVTLLILDMIFGGGTKRKRVQ